MKPINICIIGFGPWGLCVFERIVSRIKHGAQPGRLVDIHIVEPHRFGQGAHSSALPDYLLLNTKCGHVSMFVEDHFPDVERPLPGPSLLEWAKQQGYGLADDGHTLTKHGGREITDDDFLPRRLLGEYLAWFYQETMRALPAGVVVHEHHAAACGIQKSKDGELVQLEDGTQLEADHVFLTTGHTPNRYELAQRATTGRVLRVDYPISECIAQVRPGDKVGIAGFGLVAIDLVASLTLGRGGKFECDPRTGAKRYLASGAEPKIIMFSRSGLPYLARPGTSKSLASRYVPAFFTQARIDEIRQAKLARTGMRQLDFVREVLPLLWDEMLLVYYQVKQRETQGCDLGEQLRADLIEAWEAGRYKAAIQSLAQLYGEFNPERIFFMDLGSDLADAEACQRRFRSIMAEDLFESALGEVRSARKAAFELFRELRDGIRHAVDFGGLTPESHKEFVKRVAPLINRLIVGPPKSRAEEIAALIDAGVIAVPMGQSATVVTDTADGSPVLRSSALKQPIEFKLDYLYYAHIDQPNAVRSASPLLVGMVDTGRLRERTVADGFSVLDISPELHPLDASGRADERLWILGPLTEGAKYFNNYIPSPKSRIRAFQEADRCVNTILDSNKTIRPMQAGVVHMEAL